ncbi:RNA 2',3'-cyclic phosphodiesterase [Bacillus sp. EAC]|uniref:RNA 2',3'-cyclic phosphodiesterase n=1 Tax=Bacillus sp. EAC TaxID=1978338 RepID=UPI0015C5013D|nr:RNA 2',3'-cyclic phosphodiesterase [Bacillus sp. EAC]
MSEHVFLAVPLPSQIKEKLDAYAKEWNGKLPFKKWTFLEDFHITLSFLGPVTYTKSKELVKQLREELCNGKSFTLSIRDLGIFGSSDQPRVWWFGVNKSNDLIELQNQIRNICEEQGFSLEKRPYRPHITIAKKFNDTFQSNFYVPLTWDQKGVSFEVNEIVLYKIQPAKKPSYEPMEFIKLI